MLQDGYLIGSAAVLQLTEKLRRPPCDGSAGEEARGGVELREGER